jgi:hypothetical protein
LESESRQGNSKVLAEVSLQMETSKANEIAKAVNAHDEFVNAALDLQPVLDWLSGICCKERPDHWKAERMQKIIELAKKNI